MGLFDRLFRRRGSGPLSNTTDPVWTAAAAGAVHSEQVHEDEKDQGEGGRDEGEVGPASQDIDVGGGDSGGGDAGGGNGGGGNGGGGGE